MIDKRLKEALKFILFPLSSLFQKWIYTQALNNPQKWANKLYKSKFGHDINWVNPKELNEKIRWMQFNTDTTQWTELADKYAVREYVKYKGYEEILVKLYGKWNRAIDIDFACLPNSFVLKTNHGSGEIIIVKDKIQTNLEDVRHRMQHYLETPFGIMTAELHYLKIKPCIIAEELLIQDGGISSSLIDYKFYCFRGKPVACGVFYDRNVELHKNGVTLYDMEWNEHKEWRRKDLAKVYKEIPCPKTFQQMKLACKDLASQFPFVRMDFYEVDGRLYLSEFTFTPAALGGGSFDIEILKKWGNFIDLNHCCSE